MYFLLGITDDASTKQTNRRPLESGGADLRLSGVSGDVTDHGGARRPSPSVFRPSNVEGARGPASQDADTRPLAFKAKFGVIDHSPLLPR